MEVRPARPGDAARIEDVTAAATRILRQTYRPVPRPPALPSAMPPTKALVLLLEGEIIGVVEYLRRNDALHVTGLAVDPAHHRQGAARRLLEAVAEVARDRDLTRITLATIEETGNLPLFLKLGFAETARNPASRFESDRHDALTEIHLERTT